ncbi:MAG: 2-hydroxyglutaryl-CoA dehydratase [Candidatus Aminicenantes bacterium]|nr:2-hydroxyglutaryl-CoA dehydratase [Candidatus Aminicenantes bacterium]
MKDRGYLGVDVGSISANIVAADERGEVVALTYRRVEGDPIRSLQESLKDIARDLPAGFSVEGVCATGSGRMLTGSILGADIVKNEISAHARATLHLHPDARTIFEIGGQDSKMTVIREGVVVDFAMNLVCAAGTGSFLDSQAKRLNITIEELSERAVRSRNPTGIAGRCTVFAESDMIHKQQTGHAQDDILMGLCLAMVRNFLSNVCSGKEIREPIVLQGGISANRGIRRAFREILSAELIIPRYNMVMGAYGAALIAARAGLARTRFRGYEICERDITTRSFPCGDCPNRCEVIEIVDGRDLIGRSGGRCRKWEGNTDPR